jgi:hypothetical protein
VVAISNVLQAVTCVSASECWAVGESFAGSSAYPTLIERWDGTSWAVVNSPSPDKQNTLNAVTCVSALECWAVGYSSSGAPDTTLIEHWDGTAWAVVSSPNTSATLNVLRGVACVSA